MLESKPEVREDPCRGCPERPKYPNCEGNYPCPLKDKYVGKEGERK